MNLSNETKVTITIIVSVIVAFLGYRFMEDLPLFSSSESIYTHFKKVNGLTTGSYIYINGVKVGSVNQIKLQGEDSVQVSLNFNVGTHINKGSVAYLESSGLFGDKAIYIHKGNSTEEVADGGTIKGVYSGGMLESLQETGSQLADNASQSFQKLNHTLSNVQDITDQKNKHKIDEMLGNLQQASQEFSLLMQHKRNELESSINHAHDLLANMDTVTTENKAHIDSVFAGLDRSMDHLEKVSSSLEETNQRLNSILTKMDEGTGSLGKMVNDPSLYNNIDSVSVELKKLIQNINRDPGRYMKGLKLIDIF